MILYELEPEVAGGFGDNTVISNFKDVRLKRERPNVTHLHYEFSGWLGDEILTSTPCFIVTEALANTIELSDLSGYTFDNVEVSTDEVFEEFEKFHPRRILSKFKRIIPKGSVIVNQCYFNNYSGHDFCLSQDASLVVSEKALAALRKHKMDYCDLTKLKELK